MLLGVVTPFGHLVHKPALDAEYEAEGQTAQLEVPALALKPAPHAEQPAAFIVPPFVTLPAKPGAQIVQAATEVLPAAKEVIE